MCYRDDLFPCRPKGNRRRVKPILISHILLCSNTSTWYFLNDPFHIIFCDFGYSPFVEQESSKTGLIVFYKPMTEMIFHLFCCILFVRSKSPAQPILKRRGFHKVVAQRRGVIEDPPGKLPTTELHIKRLIISLGKEYK